PLAVRAEAPLDWAARAPSFADSWSAMRAHLAGVLEEHRLPAGGVVMVGDTAFEASWCAALRAAGYLSAERYFGPAA
ncbi:MAG: hypothetical protein WBA25_08800, partial [Jannaschia sp.]